MSAKNYEKALESYKRNGDWKEVLHLAEHLKFTPETKNSIALEMVEYLNTIGKYSVIFEIFKHISSFFNSLQGFCSRNWEGKAKLWAHS